MGVERESVDRAFDSADLVGLMVSVRNASGGIPPVATWGRLP